MTEDGQLRRLPRVLLVESEPLLRWSLLETLKKSPYVALAVVDARAGAMAAAEGDYDVIVVAEELCDFDGLTLLRALGRITPRARVVMAATHASRDFTDAAFAQGAVDVIEKPFPMSLFEDTLERVLRGDRRAA